MTTRYRDRLLLGAPGIALACVAFVVVLDGSSAQQVMTATLAGVGLVLVWSVAVAVYLRYPTRPLGPLLFMLAIAYSIQTLLASPNPYLFTMARAARPAVEVLLIWVMLAFPSGRLPGRSERLLVVAGALTVVLLWLPGVMLSPTISLIGPFVACHPTCPRNVLFVADWPAVSWALNAAFRTVGFLIMMATGVLLFRRLQQATPLLRRAIAPVLFASIARTVVMAVFLLATDSHFLVMTLTFWALPIAIALGLLRGRLYTARALQLLVSGLRGRPDMHALRDVMARALGDDTLLIAYWLNDGEHWVDADNQRLVLPESSISLGRAVTLLHGADGQPVAALVHDSALLEEPTLIEAVTSSMQIALESHRLEAEINASSARSVCAVEAERHRIERDLHDGAQQRLIALRMKLSVTARLFEQDPRRAEALVQEMGLDVDAAMVELRALAHGMAPPLLVERGLAAALVEAAQRAAMPIQTQIEDVGRCDAGIERAVYYCCLEALQNTAKHAGADACAQLTLNRVGDMLLFTIVDDGTTVFTLERSGDGKGLSNMRERIETIGGQLEIQALPGMGFRVAGTVMARRSNTTF